MDLGSTEDFQVKQVRGARPEDKGVYTRPVWYCFFHFAPATGSTRRCHCKSHLMQATVCNQDLFNMDPGSTEDSEVKQIKRGPARKTRRLTQGGWSGTFCQYAPAIGFTRRRMSGECHLSALGVSYFERLLDHNLG